MWRTIGLLVSMLGCVITFFSAEESRQKTKEEIKKELKEEQESEES